MKVFEIDKDDEGDLKKTQEELIVKADEGDILLLRKNLSNLNEDENKQRENMFHSRYTIQEKFCSLIIDEESCAIIVSLGMVEKLNLHATSHPHPYHVHWVNQDKGLPVKSRSFISFTIGKHYQHQTWFDVILMDACHAMLGRPWLYDRKVMHNRHLNTYSLSKGGKTITLTPLNSTQLKNSKP